VPTARIAARAYTEGDSVQRPWSSRRKTTWALVAAPVLAVASLSAAAVGNAAVPRAHHAAAAPAERYVASQYTVAPNPQGTLVDCNGWSNKSPPIAPHRRGLCTDPHGIPGKFMGSGCKGYHYGYSGLGRFVDNCHYVGHDEPSVKFISTSPGSGF